MATSNPKIKYDIEADVKGEASVEELARTLGELGDTLEGELSQQARTAAEALAALGAKQQAIDTFKTLSADARTLTTAMDSAALKVGELGNQFAPATAATKAFAQAETQARTEATGLKALLDEQRAALRQLRTETTGAARQTDDYRAAEAQLKTTIKSLAADLQQKNAAVRTASTAAAQAALEEKKLNTEYQNAVKSARQVSAELGNKNRALNAARGALDAAGIGTKNLSQAERNLGEAVVKVRQEVLSMAPAYRAAQQASDASTQKQVQNQRTLREGMASIGTQLQRIQSLAAAAIGGSYLGGMIKDVASTADEFKNLEARVKLATGEGQSFERSFDGVTRVALETNSALDETGTLFARLTKASEEGGMAAEAAQQRALGLTQTINQATQLSGGTAESAKAAITQLIQGLQSGVLRGEEFNSVMEQAPRLAQAMAAGLGKTTGQLRAMAKEGELTAETVMRALEGQSAAVAAEFGKLPATVGRALQNLTTQWTLYVGASDKGLISSANAAKVIDTLANNLDTLVDTLTVAGKIWATMKIAEMATHFAAWATKTVAATVAMEANTAATATNTIAHRANAAAVAAGAAAQGASATAATANAAAMARSGAFSAAAQRATAGVGTAAAAAAPQVGLLGRAVGGLSGLMGGPLGLIAITALLWPEIQRLGTWLGESAAKMMGYRDRTEEMAEADRRAAEASQALAREQAALAQDAAKAAEAKRGLTEGARTMVGAFDKARDAGKGVAEALAEISKNANLREAQGINDFSIALRDLERQGRISGEAVREAMADALRGEDLAAFEVRARAAFAGVADSAGLMEVALDAKLREAIRRSGADFAVLSGGMSAASKSAINDTEAIVAGMGRLKAQGVDVGKALEASLGQAIKTADSQAAVDALRARIQDLRKVLGEKVANGLLAQLEEQARKATGALGGLEGALKQLGITSDAELKKASTEARALYDAVVKTGGSAREQSAAFEKMATAAIASGDSAAIAFAKSQAAARGFEIATDAGGKTIVRSMKDAAKAANDAGSAVNGLTKSIDGASAAAQRYIGWADRMQERNKRVGSDAADEAERKRLGVDKDGFTLDKSGNRMAAGGDLNTLTGIAAFLKSAGIDDDATARRIATEFSDGKGNIPYFSNPGQKRYGGDTISVALLRAAERITFAGAGVGGANVPGIGTSIPKQQAREVNFNLRVNGREMGTVPTTESGADVLMRGLEEARRSAGK